MPLSLMSMLPMLVMMPVITIMLTRHHLLMCLLNLEVMILGLVTMLMPPLSGFSLNNPTMVLIILTLGACGASLGLACLVKMTRSYGNDNMMSMSLMKC